MNGLKITEKAAKEIKRVMEEQELENYHLRVGVTGGGCSGFQYSMNFEELDKLNEEADLSEQQHEIQVVVDKKSMLFLDGTTLDFVDDDINRRGFAFNNPNATRTCGCGSSFSG